MKKFLIALLTLAMVLTLFPASILAEISGAQTAISYVKGLKAGTYNIQAVSTKTDLSSEFAANGMYYPSSTQLIVTPDGQYKVKVVFYTSSDYKWLQIGSSTVPTVDPDADTAAATEANGYYKVQSSTSYDDAGKTKYYTTFEFNINPDELAEYTGASAQTYTHYVYANVRYLSGEAYTWKGFALAFNFTNAVPVLDDGQYAMGVEILRTGNVSEQYIGTPPSYDAIVKDFTVTNGKMNATVLLGTSSLTKLYMGSYTDAQTADAAGSADVIPLSQDANGRTVLSIPVEALDKPITVSLFQTSMGGVWREYTLRFYDNTSNQGDSDTLVVDPGTIQAVNGSITIDGRAYKKVTIPAEALSAIAGNEVTILTVNGTVTFSSTAISGIVSKAAGAITLSFNDISSNLIYANAGYDKVIDLTLTDAGGNALFTEGSAGVAAITVPYTKTVETGKKAAVYYIAPTGKVAVITDYNAVNKTVTFQASHFSSYAITQTADAANAVNTPQTGDAGMEGLYLLALLASAALAGGLLIKRKIYQ